MDQEYVFLDAVCRKSRPREILTHPLHHIGHQIVMHFPILGHISFQFALLYLAFDILLISHTALQNTILTPLTSMIVTVNLNIVRHQLRNPCPAPCKL